MKRIFLIAPLLLVVFLAKGQSGERIKAMKVTYISNRLDLSTDEAEKFWPIYSANEKAEKAIRQKYRFKGSLITITDNEADEAIQNHIKMSEELLEQKRKYLTDLQKVVPSRKILLLNKAEREFNVEVLKALKEKRRNKD